MKVEFMEHDEGTDYALMSFKDAVTVNKVYRAFLDDEQIFPFTEQEIIDLVERGERPEDRGLIRPEIIINNETTIMLVNGTRYIAKPEKGEVYDKEKGVLMCLAKACGFTTSDVLDMVANAKVQKTGNGGNKKRYGHKINKK